MSLAEKLKEIAKRHVARNCVREVLEAVEQEIESLPSSQWEASYVLALIRTARKEIE